MGPSKSGHPFWKLLHKNRPAVSQKRLKIALWAIRGCHQVPLVSTPKVTPPFCHLHNVHNRTHTWKKSDRQGCVPQGITFPTCCSLTPEYNYNNSLPAEESFSCIAQWQSPHVTKQGRNLSVVWQPTSCYHLIGVHKHHMNQINNILWVFISFWS